MTRAHSSLSNILVGVGIAGLAGAAVLWFLGGPDAPAATDSGENDDDDDDEVAITPVFGRDQVGVSFVGSF